MTNAPLGEAGARLRALVAELPKLLRPFIDHSAGCSINVNAANPDGDYCTCGVRQAIEKSNAIVAELEALLSAPVVSGWQPIETAPKDSSPILAIKPGWVTPRLMCWLDGVALGKPGWRLFDNNPEFGPYQPTHWMPLPAAPVVTQEGEEPCP